VDFRNAVLIMTSNVGSDVIFSTSDPETMRERVEDVLRSTFRPEFLNRIDETVIFRRLEQGELRRVVDLQLRRVAARLAERRIELRVTDDARDAIVAQGYDPAFGARPLRRAIQRLVENPLAVRLLEGGLEPGTVVEVDVEAGELVLRSEPALAAVA
jgi:ATP-dependent Clp protease ATP-binding subunit ClpB